MASQRKSILPIICTLAMLSCAPFAAEAVEVGDAVEFQRAGQTFTGKVTALRPGGIFVEVETLVDGTPRRIIVKSESVKPLAVPGGMAFRTWSDPSGRFRIEARLESQTAFEVVLRKKDGAQIKVPLEKLSTADQEYVATLDTGGGSENPFEAGIMKSPASNVPASNVPASNVPASNVPASNVPASNLPASSGASGGTLVLPPAVSLPKGSELQIRKMESAEGFSPDPSPLDFSKIGNASMNIPEIEQGEDAPSRPLIISSSGTSLCYNVLSGRGSTGLFTKIFLIDALKRTTKQMAKIDGHRIWLCAADPTSGNVLGAVLKQGEDRARSLCVISGIADGNPRIVAHWQMFPGDERASDYVRFRKLLPNQIAITFYSNRVQAVDYGSGKEVWSISAKAFNEPAISPGGKYAAVMADDQCAIVETKTGKQVGSIPVSGNVSTSAGFSSDASRLALVQYNQARVFDVASGEEQMVHEASVQLGGSGKRILWLEDKFLLLPTGNLLNVDRNLILWKYSIAQDALEYTDMEHHGLLMFTGRNVLSVVRLPHDAARDEADRDTTGITAVKPGDPISIAANASGPGVSANDLRQWLTDAATKAGYVVANNAPTQLAATITRGETRTETYRIIGMGFRQEQVTFTPYISKVEFKQNGKSLWQQSTRSGLPFMIPSGKTLQEVAKQNERPSAGFFQNVKLPRQVIKPEYQNGFGNSRVDERGITD
jgi:hypothetical protein